MMVVMTPDATAAQIEAIVERLEAAGVHAKVMPGTLTGSTMRCFRVARGRTECPFVVQMIYRPEAKPEAVMTCLGSIVLHRGRAPRFRNGLSCVR